MSEEKPVLNFSYKAVPVLSTFLNMSAVVKLPLKIVNDILYDCFAILQDII